RKPLLGPEGYGCLCPLLRQAPFPAEVMEPGRKGQGKFHAKGVRQLPGQRQRFVASLQGLVWIAEPPESQGGIGSAMHSGVLPVAEGMRTVPLAVVKGHLLLEMGLGSGELAQIVAGAPEGTVGLQEKRRVVDMLRQGEELLPHLSRRL